MTSEVNRSNTLDDIGDNELFKSSLEPSEDKGQLISKCLSSNLPKNNIIFVRISALAS